MPKVRTAPYVPGGKFVVYIPENISANALKFINTQKYISPMIIDLVESAASRVYLENVKVDKKEIDR